MFVVLSSSKNQLPVIQKNLDCDRNHSSDNSQFSLQTYSKNGQVNQQANADRPVSSLLGFVRTLQLVVDPS